MKAEIITIGDEILIGQTLNTNAAFIGSKLTELQIDVSFSCVVHDNETDIKNEFKRAYEHNDLVFVTGGLGPTNDDVTRNCVVEYFKTELVQNEEVLEDIKKFCEVRGRTLTKTNEGQALVPKIATAIRNNRGTTPGYWIEKNKKVFIVMPGVPYEMKSMMENFVIPNLKERVGNSKVFKKTVNLLTTGIPESILYDRLGNLEDLLNGASLAFLPSQFGVKMRITTQAESDELAMNKIDAIEQRIRGFVGKYIYGKNDDALESIIAKLLIDRNLKISVAESCTGGLIANRITNISGSSKFFERGVVAYSNAAKVEILKVNEDTIANNGAVSHEVAMQMAEGIKSISGADIGLATTGIMGPTGATPNKPVGLVYIGICDDKICSAKEFRFGDDRLLNKDRASQAALEMLRRNLLGISNDD